MATQQDILGSTEAAILARIIRPENDDLSSEAATALLRLDFDRADMDRLNELVTRNQEGTLSGDEHEQLEGYLRMSAFLDLMHAKARRSLKPRH